MAGNITAFPKLPVPRQEVDVRYLTDLVRALESFINQVQNPGPQRGTAQTLTNLQKGNDALHLCTMHFATFATYHCNMHMHLHLCICICTFAT